MTLVIFVHCKDSFLQSKRVIKRCAICFGAFRRVNQHLKGVHNLKDPEYSEVLVSFSFYLARLKFFVN